MANLMEEEPLFKTRIGKDDMKTFLVLVMQGLKPCFVVDVYGTTKVVPFQNEDSS